MDPFEAAIEAAETVEDVVRVLEPSAVAVFLGAGAVILAAELIGVYREHEKGDTISEIVWWVRDKLPVPARYTALGAWLAFVAWLTAHFVFGGS